LLPTTSYYCPCIGTSCLCERGEFTIDGWGKSCVGVGFLE
jgi:hypothetical protein